MDSTHIQANIAVQSAVNLLKQGRRIIVKKISKTNPKEAESLKEKYVTKEGHHAPPKEGEIEEELRITKNFIKETKEILDEDKSKGIKHEAVAADSLYDSFDNRKNIRSQNMRAFISSRDRGRKKNLDRFTYDNKNDTLVCPEGHSPISKSRQETRDLFIFSAKSCRNCPQQKGCPKLNKGRVRITVSDNYRLSILDNIPEKKDAFIKRKSIERKFGEAKVWHKLCRARYRERTRVAIQVLMTFMVLNVKRMASLLGPAPEYALCKAGYG